MYEIDRTCNMHGRSKKCKQNLSWKVEEQVCWSRRRLKRIQKMDVKNLVLRVRSWLSWLRMWSNWGSNSGSRAVVYRDELGGLVGAPVSVNLILCERYSVCSFLFFPFTCDPVIYCIFLTVAPTSFCFRSLNCRAWWALHAAVEVLILPGCCGELWWYNLILFMIVNTGSL